MCLCACTVYRRRLRKIRSRSQYVLHDAELTGSTQTFDGWDNKQTAGTSGRRAEEPTPIYKRSVSCAGTWQRTRPLPVPRPVDENDDQRSRDDDDVMAMTPLTSACSEHLLMSPGAGEEGVLNHVATCCTPGATSDAECVDAGMHRGLAACDLRAGCCPSDLASGGGGPVAHGRTRSTPQPIDATRLLLLQGAEAASSHHAVSTTAGGGGGYERCFADRVPASTGGGPYYFKLDLTSGLSRAGTERPASPPCMMCVQQQQQQQRHATLPRRITSSPSQPPQRALRY